MKGPLPDHMMQQCMQQIGKAILNTCGDTNAVNEPFPGRPYPGNASVRRGVRFDIQSSSLFLMDLVPGSVPPQYEPLAQVTANPTTPFTDASTIVTQITVPAGYQVQTARVKVSTSDPESEDTVLFAVYNGQDLIVPAWDGNLQNIVDIPVGGDLAIGGNAITFSVRAIVNPDRWSSPAGNNPLRSQIKAYATLEVTSLANVPNGLRRECPPEGVM